MINELTGLLKKLPVGGMLAIDNVPPFVVKFDWYPNNWQKDGSSEYDYASYPGARHQYPIFKNCQPKSFSFTTQYDISNRNGNYYADNLNSTMIAEDIGKGKTFKFMGANYISVNAQQIAGTDYIKMIKSLYEKLVNPKFGASANVQNAAGKILNVSQGKSDPAPPLVLLIKNSVELFLGYLSEAKPKELLYNNLGYCTRIEFECKFLTNPDLVFTTMDDAITEVNVYRSLLSF